MQDENAINAQKRPQKTPKRTPASKKRKNPDEPATPTSAAKRRALADIASPNTPTPSKFHVNIKKEPKYAVYSDGTGVQLLAVVMKEDMPPPAPPAARSEETSRIEEASFTTAAASMLDMSIDQDVDIDGEQQQLTTAATTNRSHRVQHSQSEQELEQFVTIKEEDKESVLGALYLGNSEVASNHDWLRIEDIKAVVNAAVELKEFQYPCESYNVKLEDAMEEKLFKVKDVDDAVDFIAQNRTNGKSVLVHCRMGRSRSVAIVLIYLMKHANMPLKDAQDLLLSKGVDIRLNQGFQQELMLIEQETFGQRSLDYFSRAARRARAQLIWNPYVVSSQQNQKKLAEVGSAEKKRRSPSTAAKTPAKPRKPRTPKSGSKTATRSGAKTKKDVSMPASQVVSGKVVKQLTLEELLQRSPQKNANASQIGEISPTQLANVPDFSQPMEPEDRELASDPTAELFPASTPQQEQQQ